MRNQNDLTSPSTMLARIRVTMFDGDGFEQIMAHVRNIVTASIVMAAGVWAIGRGNRENFWGILDEAGPGFMVALIGLALFLLNVLDGWHRLNRSKNHVVLTAVLAVLYVFTTVRVGQIILNFQSI